MRRRQVVAPMDSAAAEPTIGGDLRGVGRLAIEAVAGLANLVETVHANVARLPGMPPPSSGRTRGLAALGYGGVRAITSVVSGAVDTALALLEPLLCAKSTEPGYEAVRAALNGVIGDWLEERGNPLAIKMCLRSGGVALRLEASALALALPHAGGKIVVFVHGLCMNHLQWARNGADFAGSLARDLGVTPIHLHYNTGRHVSTNGREFAELMDALVRAWPVMPLESIDLVTHSMGGLVARSALHQAAQNKQHWPRLVRKLVFIGTPHQGAPLERGGQRLNMLLSFSPYTEPFRRLGELRSAGITDLRFGSLLDSDWQGQDRFASRADSRTPVKLPDGVDIYAIGAISTASDDSMQARFVGDGLVPLDSALARHPDPRRALPIPADHQWVATRTNHLQLQTSPAVYARVRSWLSQP
jgi:pimeloyl-ACP methyl ester carboxylesterase